MEIPKEIGIKMFYCEQFKVKISPDVCKHRKSLANRYKSMTHNEKFGKHLAIEMMIDKCLPCEIGDKNKT